MKQIITKLLSRKWLRRVHFFRPFKSSSALTKTNFDNFQPPLILVLLNLIDIKLFLKKSTLFHNNWQMTNLPLHNMFLLCIDTEYSRLKIDEFGNNWQYFKVPLHNVLQVKIYYYNFCSMFNTYAAILSI